MGNCYELLGINPAALTDEIEEAYRRKKIEFTGDPLKLQELDSAYNEAIMATFAPIRAFSSPLPPLTIGKKSPEAHKPEPVRDVPIQETPLPFIVQPLPQAQPQISPIQLSTEPAPAYAPEPFMETLKPAYKAPYIASSVDPMVRELVEEVPVSFTDDELLNMDVSELRGRFARNDAKSGPGILSLGIENTLLRQYVWTYIGLAVFDMVMRLLFGAKWLAMSELLNPGSAGTMPPVYLSVFFAPVSVVYCFICSIPIPFAIRFFLLGQPPEKPIVMYCLFSLSVTLSQILQNFIGFLLPPDIAGSWMTSTFASMLLAFETLRYAGD